MMLLRPLFDTLRFTFLLACCLFLLPLASAQRCAGTPHACGDVTPDHICLDVPSLALRTCDDDFFGCTSHDGCTVSVNGYSCSSGAVASCEARVVCGGTPTACSAYEGRFSCEGHSGCYWIPKLEDVPNDVPGICQGSTNSCRSATVPRFCSSKALCDSYKLSCERGSCEDRSGCLCLTSEFECVQSLFTNTCSGRVVCQGEVLDSCSEMETQSDCVGHDGCEWTILERPPTASPVAATPMPTMKPTTLPTTQPTNGPTKIATQQPVTSQATAAREENGNVDAAPPSSSSAPQLILVGHLLVILLMTL